MQCQTCLKKLSEDEAIEYKPNLYVCHKCNNKYWEYKKLKETVKYSSILTVAECEICHKFYILPRRKLHDDLICEDCQEDSKKGVKAKYWREEVLYRDNHECQECGKETDLHIHHIKSWKNYPELRFEKSNGLTLCEECHKKTKSYGNTTLNREDEK